MFFEYQACKTLSRLSAEPVDLRIVFTPERIRQMILKGAGFELAYGAERISPDVLDALYQLAEESSVLDKMKRMQAGEVLNRIEGYDSENRSVLHTAMRDQFSHKQTARAAASASEKASAELQKLQRFLEETEGRFTDLIQIGIGGSDLGPRALCIALQPFHKPGRRVHFLSNVDPDDAHFVLSQVDLKRTMVVIVSKSGTTIETLTNEELVRAHIRKEGLDPNEHCVAVTEENSPMDDASRYLASFYIWDFVGGRYSATSMAGGVALGFCLGFPGFQEILRGAHDMDRHVLIAPERSNLPLLSALLGLWNRSFLHLPTVAVIPYSQALARFPAHLQQLDMESNGKRIDRMGHPCAYDTGPVVWGEPGTNGQHSFYQLIHQGTQTVPLELIGFKKSQYLNDLEVECTTSQEKLLSNLLAQSIALAVGQKHPNPNKQFPGNRPSRILMAHRLDPLTMGALLSFYEHKVAFQGFLWDINSFDQEGVQLGKVLANKIISRFRAKRTEERVEPFPLAAAYLDTLDIL